MHTHTRTHTRSCNAHAHTNDHVQAHKNTRTHAHKHTEIHTQMPSRINTHTYIHANTNTYTYTHTHKHTLTHQHVHTNTKRSHPSEKSSSARSGDDTLDSSPNSTPGGDANRVWMRSLVGRVRVRLKFVDCHQLNGFETVVKVDSTSMFKCMYA